MDEGELLIGDLSQFVDAVAKVADEGRRRSRAATEAVALYTLSLSFCYNEGKKMKLLMGLYPDLFTNHCCLFCLSILTSIAVYNAHSHVYIRSGN